MSDEPISWVDWTDCIEPDAREIPVQLTYSGVTYFGFLKVPESVTEGDIVTTEMTFRASPLGRHKPKHHILITELSESK